MLPTVEEALAELKIAESRNPGPWVQHSIHVGLAARNIAQRVPGLDPEKAQVLGLLHDIGRREGILSIPGHVWQGYRFCTERGWDEAARVCMIHTYPLMEQELPEVPDTFEERQIREYLLTCGEPDEYDRLIQLCDAVAADYGFVILEKRFVDVTRRHGIMPTYIQGWELTFATKERLEQSIGCSIYDLLPGIEKTTLLCPKPWKPEESSHNP